MGVKAHPILCTGSHGVAVIGFILFHKRGRRPIVPITTGEDDLLLLVFPEQKALLSGVVLVAGFIIQQPQHSAARTSIIN